MRVTAWGIAAIVFVAVAILSIIISAITREIVNRRRERATGLGGTQDIALAELLVLGVCIAGALVCGAMWMLHI